jgi:hypothetical protein
MQEVRERTGGQINLSPSTLYSDPSHDDLEKLLSHARSSGLAPKRV